MVRAAAIEVALREIRAALGEIQAEQRPAGERHPAVRDGGRGRRSDRSKRASESGWFERSDGAVDTRPRLMRAQFNGPIVCPNTPNLAAARDYFHQ